MKYSVLSIFLNCWKLSADGLLNSTRDIQKVLMLVLIAGLMLICVQESSATVRCKYPEVPVRLGPKENHTVPICPRGVSNWDSGPEGLEPLKQDIFKCDALVCNRCRCDVKMGYKLSNDTNQAECVMFCPRIRSGEPDRGCISARTGQPCA